MLCNNITKTPLPKEKRNLVFTKLESDFVGFHNRFTGTQSMFILISIFTQINFLVMLRGDMHIIIGSDYYTG